LRPSSLSESRVHSLRDENWRSPSDVLLAKLPPVVIDRIHIEQLEVHGRVGVPDSERAEPQRLILNVTMWPEIAESRDDIGNTVNYSEVAASLRQFVNRHACKLIETLAEETAAHLLAQFNLRKVEVEVRKFVLPETDYVSVTAIRENEITPL
jgi:dihydroneopterin aldolase